MSAYSFETREDGDSLRARETAIWRVLLGSVTTAASRTISGLRRQRRNPRRLGQYTLVAKLGEGGMGSVYRARHAMLRRPTAIKLLPPEMWSERAVARFEREVQRTAELTHPNIVTIFDYGRTPDGVTFYAMELLEGATLETVLDETGPLPAGRVIHVLEGVAGALVEVHEKGLIHGDLKPSNIILCRQGARDDVPKVLDFGLVKELGDATSSEAHTMSDVLTGTPLYMSPEAIARPASIDARSDLYALGAVGYYLLTGRHVFEGQTVVEVCAHHLRTPPPPMGDRGVSVASDLDGVVLACLAKAPEDRPASARILRDMLRACDEATTWGENDAAEWWRNAGDRLRATSEAANPEVATLSVDRATGP